MGDEIAKQARSPKECAEPTTRGRVPPARPSQTQRLVDIRRWCRDGTARSIRLDSDLTLAETAAAVLEYGGVTVTPQSVWRWELGKLLPRGDHATAYHAALTAIASQQHGRPTP